MLAARRFAAQLRLRTCGGHGDVGVLLPLRVEDERQGLLILLWL